jgi:hypothetical protein
MRSFQQINEVFDRRPFQLQIFAEIPEIQRPAVMSRFSTISKNVLTLKRAFSETWWPNCKFRRPAGTACWYPPLAMTIRP